MKAEKILQALLAVARRRPIVSSAPWDFERRVMARLAATPRRATDPLREWTQALWRAAAPAMAAALVVGGLRFASGGLDDPAGIDAGDDPEALSFSFNNSTFSAW